MNVYTIYKNPSDFPGDYVIKRWIVNSVYKQPVQDLNYIFVNNDLEVCRNELKKLGLYNLGNDEKDDAVILENWV